MKSYLIYNPANDHYGIDNGIEWMHEGYHCGEALKIRINGVWVLTRMEMDNDSQWYLTGTAFRGKMLNGIQAKRYVLKSRNNMYCTFIKNIPVIRNKIGAYIWNNLINSKGRCNFP